MWDLKVYTNVNDFTTLKNHDGRMVDGTMRSGLNRRQVNILCPLNIW